MKHELGGITAKLIGLLCFAFILGVLYFARGPLLRFAGESWVVEDPLQKADAIIVLSADNFYADRATRAAELYRQALAPIVVASGERLRPRAGVAELMTHDLVERGVQKEHVVPFPHDADDMREEAAALNALVAQKGWKIGR